MARQGWLFPDSLHSLPYGGTSGIGSPEAGEKAAVIYSMLLTCEIHGVEAHAWMKDVLTKAPVTADEASQKALLPYNWKS